MAKVTINPAITFGIGHVVGSIAPGKMADLVLWTPQAFGAKPKLVIKGGLINWALMGDPNASLPTTQPIMYRPMFGAYGSALTRTSVTFVSRAGWRRASGSATGSRRSWSPVRGTRTIGKADMVRNDATPRVEVDPETFAVTVDGVHATVEPVEPVSLNQLYFFS